MADASLGNPERRLLKAMQAQDADKSWNMDDILSACGWNDQAKAAGAALGLVQAGFAEVDEQSTTLWSLGPEGKAALENGLLEERLWNWLSGQPEGNRAMADLQSSGVVEKHETGIGIGLLKGLGISIEAGNLVLPEETSAIEAEIQARSEFLSNISEGPKSGETWSSSPLTQVLRQILRVAAGLTPCSP